MVFMEDVTDKMRDSTDGSSRSMETKLRIGASDKSKAKSHRSFLRSKSYNGSCFGGLDAHA